MTVTNIPKPDMSSPIGALLIRWYNLEEEYSDASEIILDITICLMERMFKKSGQKCRQRFSWCEQTMIIRRCSKHKFKIKRKGKLRKVLRKSYPEHHIWSEPLTNSQVAMIDWPSLTRLKCSNWVVQQRSICPKKCILNCKTESA